MSVPGHSLQGRPSGKFSHERGDAESGSQFRTLAATLRAWRNAIARTRSALVLYRARNLVERFFNKIKQCRRVATRCDKLAAKYLAFIQLASIRLWLRVNEATS